MNCKLGLKRCQQLRIAGQAKRTFPIIFQAIGNQLGDAHGRNKTGSDATAERCTGARENRCACPQGVADSRMRSERRRIEEQVGEPMPCQMLVIACDTTGKEKPARDLHLATAPLSADCPWHYRSHRRATAHCRRDRAGFPSRRRKSVEIFCSCC